VLNQKLIIYLFILNCDVDLIGTDDANHSLTIQVASNLPVLQPGIDFYSPTATITTIPAEDEDGKVTGTTPFAVIFDASSSTDVGSGIESIIWDFGDGTTGTEIIENHTYDNSGLYFVTLTVTDFYGNEGNDAVTITVNEPKAPIAVITTVPDPATGSAPFTVYFDAYDSEPDPECEFGCEIVSYEWDFGDETIGTGVATNHTYDNPGLYIVTLTVTDLNGKEGNDTVTITVNEAEAPTAKINTTPTTVGEIVTITALSTVYFDAYESATDPECEFGCEIVSYVWDFGDGSSGIGITTNHTYSNIGTYTAMLTVTDSNGKKGYDSVKIEVKKVPIAKINTVPVAVGEIVTITALSTVYFDAYESTSDSGIVSYAWNFGDGSTGGAGITTSHTYSGGTADYTAIVILTITDANGYKAYDSVEIVIDCGCPEEE